jgi:hypothetical protein
LRLPPQQAATTTAPRTPPKAQRAVGTPHPRGTNFELHKQIRGRWQLDAIFDDKGLAVEEAKAFLARSREQVAVRVMAVEPRDAEFLEIIVFRGANDRSKGVAGKERKITTNTEVVAHGVRRGDGGGFSLAGLRRSPVVTAGAALLALVLVFAFLNYRNTQRSTYALDLPDAMKSHTVRTPWQDQ